MCAGGLWETEARPGLPCSSMFCLTGGDLTSSVGCASSAVLDRVSYVIPRFPCFQAISTSTSLTGNCKTLHRYTRQGHRHLPTRRAGCEQHFNVLTTLKYASKTPDLVEAIFGSSLIAALPFALWMLYSFSLCHMVGGTSHATTYTRIVVTLMMAWRSPEH